MENGIMGEKLKGLYDSIHNLMGTKSKVSKLTDEFDRMLLTVNKLAKDYIRMKSEFKEVVIIKDSLVEDYYQMSNMRTQISNQKDSLAKLFKENTTYSYSLSSFME